MGDNTLSAEDNKRIENLIHVIRGRQVMLDSDLAALYQVETRTFNQAVSRNIERFPDNFRFQLTDEEYTALRSQIVISNTKGGRRYNPYVFTEQGIAMLSGILKSNVAVQISIKIMNTFVEMRHFIAENALLFEKVNKIELIQAEFQRTTDEKFNKVFKYIEDHAESQQMVFFEGQVYDAYNFIVSVIQKAKSKIVLIDGYVDNTALSILSKKNTGVAVFVYTSQKAQLTQQDISKFNAQYPVLSVKYTSAFHDRFIILDDNTVYHIGASIQDAGKKCFALSQWKDTVMINDLIKRINEI